MHNAQRRREGAEPAACSSVSLGSSWSIFSVMRQSPHTTARATFSGALADEAARVRRRGLEQHVARLQVAVHNAHAVQVVDAVGDVQQRAVDGALHVQMAHDSAHVRFRRTVIQARHRSCRTGQLRGCTDCRSTIPWLDHMLTSIPASMQAHAARTSHRGANKVRSCPPKPARARTRSRVASAFL